MSKNDENVTLKRKITKRQRNSDNSKKFKGFQIGSQTETNKFDISILYSKDSKLITKFVKDVIRELHQKGIVCFSRNCPVIDENVEKIKQEIIQSKN